MSNQHIDETLFKEGKDFAKEFYPAHEWLVENLLATGVRRPSGLFGVSGAGKSTLARQLVVSVLSGKDWLGLKTKKAPVLYWQTEEENYDVKKGLIDMGWNPEADAKLILYQGLDEKYPVASLRNALLAHPDIGLVVVENLDNLLQLEDVNNNSKAREVFKHFIADMHAIVPSTVFVLLHPLNKSDEQGSSRKILGGSYIAGNIATKMYLVEDDKQRRWFHAIARPGKNFPKTCLQFDPVTKISSAGMTYQDVLKDRAEGTKEECVSDILNVLINKPGITRKECLRLVEHNNALKRHAFNGLEVSGRIACVGSGVKGDPHLYSVVESDIPMEAHRELKVAA